MSEPDVAELSANIASAVIGLGDLDAAIADLRRLPASMPVRAKFAAGLVTAIMRSGTMPPPQRMRELGYLVELAEQDPPDDPQWPRHRTAARVSALMHAAMEGTIRNPREALDELAVLEREGGGGPGLRPLFEAARMGLGLARAVDDDDIGAMSRLPAEAEAFFAQLPPGVAGRDELRDLLGAMTGTMAARQTGGDFAAGVRDLQRAAEKLTPDDDLRTMLKDYLSAVDVLSPEPDGSADRVSDDRLAALVARAERPRQSAADRAIFHSQVAAACLRAGQETSLERVATGVEHLRLALGLTPAGDPQRSLNLIGLAVGLIRQSELTSTTAGRREAQIHLAEARTLAGGPHHPHWQLINEMLGDLDRTLGDTADFHRTAVDGLRGHVWQVLVQPDQAGAFASVRTAAADAIAVARNCLAASDPESAIAALDAGRGLALFAATGLRTLADRLETVDPALAARWRAAAGTHDAGQVPGELRREVLTALAGHHTAVSLLDPPGLDEIQAALVATDADALVYLVPGPGPLPGYAVIAPAAGPPSFMALPGLSETTLQEMEEVLAILAARETATRDLGPADGTPSVADGLARMCTWAWDAAVGPLITSYLPRVPRSPTGRPHRVVLVPMGELARVPWQAAQRDDGRYAIQEIAISQAASARMLCHSAGRPPVPASVAGLLVGDPDTTAPEPDPEVVAPDLTAARLEAYAIRQALYPGARYVGRRPDVAGSVSPSGAGSGREVRDWLTTDHPAAGSMLHLACHGFVRSTTGAPTAYLLLAGGEKLTAAELVTLMAQAPDRDVDLVVLAACRTGLSMTGYDEAYSLGTAFLAGGARSVLSTQWSIPDTATSALMFMFHRHLRVTGSPAWQALRDAQLWMLDPDRETSADMPRPLASRLDRAGLDAVAAWAAFVHWGR